MFRKPPFLSLRLGPVGADTKAASKKPGGRVAC